MSSTTPTHPGYFSIAPATGAGLKSLAWLECCCAKTNNLPAMQG